MTETDNANAEEIENASAAEDGHESVTDDQGDQVAPKEETEGETEGGLTDEEYRQTVSQLLRVSAPPTFKHDVEETIRRRSGGRFFGRKAFGERIPYELLAILVLLIGLGAYYVLRSSTTGSLRYEQNKEVPKMAPGARDVVPQPRKLEKK